MKAWADRYANYVLIVLAVVCALALAAVLLACFCSCSSTLSTGSGSFPLPLPPAGSEITSGPALICDALVPPADTVSKAAAGGSAAVRGKGTCRVGLRASPTPSSQPPAVPTGPGASRPTHTNAPAPFAEHPHYMTMVDPDLSTTVETGAASEMCCATPDYGGRYTRIVPGLPLPGGGALGGMYGTASDSGVAALGNAPASTGSAVVGSFQGQMAWVWPICILGFVAGVALAFYVGKAGVALAGASVAGLALSLTLARFATAIPWVVGVGLLAAVGWAVWRARLDCATKTGSISYAEWLKQFLTPEQKQAADAIAARIHVPAVKAEIKKVRATLPVLLHKIELDQE